MTNNGSSAKIVTLSSITMAITGASGIPYAKRLLSYLVKSGVQIRLIYSSAAQIVAKQECDWELASDMQIATQRLEHEFNAAPEQIKVFAHDDWFSPAASGSNVSDAMVICPASMGTIAAIACGLSDNLIERAADVCLKEKRQLILVPRETPLSTIHLSNLLKLSECGAVVIPPSPAFYHHPQSIDDLIDFVVARILNHLNIEHDLLNRWGEGLKKHLQNPY
ncbi:MAG: UbiX family flavin prenyltransferase [Neisseriaceae bacterium]|nr:UbiX family flavin prenyltransferase [Neisseriaceae bacterium]